MASIAACLDLTAGSLPVQAQTSASSQVAKPEQTAAPANGNASSVGEVVVTARRREERIQDVPIAVSAITSAQLARPGVNQVQQL